MRKDPNETQYVKTPEIKKNIFRGIFDEKNSG